MEPYMDRLMRFDAWLERGEGGIVPADLLRLRGIEIADPAALDDAALPGKLWKLVESLAEIGIYFYYTDHLSDREFYEYLVSEILPEETFLDPEDPTMGDICSPIGGCSNEDNRIYTTYYADDEQRRRWQAEFDEPLPPRQPHPFDRDRFLPTLEERVTTRGPLS